MNSVSWMSCIENESQRLFEHNENKDLVKNTDVIFRHVPGEGNKE